MFPYAQVRSESPYVVHDRIIFGEVSTLIPIESSWCRGYMMLQTEEIALLDYYANSIAQLLPVEATAQAAE